MVLTTASEVQRLGLERIAVGRALSIEPRAFASVTPTRSDAPVRGSCTDLQNPVQGRLTLGDAVSIKVSNGLGGAPGGMFIGVGPASKIVLPLFGGIVCVSPAVSLPIRLGGTPGTPGVGTASLPLVLPSTTSVIGVNVNFQAVFLDAGAPQGVSMTNGVEMWIG